MEPARSAALYAQYWQQKATIFGLKPSDSKFLVSLGRVAPESHLGQNVALGEDLPVFVMLHFYRLVGADTGADAGSGYRDSIPTHVRRHRADHGCEEKPDVRAIARDVDRVRQDVVDAFCLALYARGSVGDPG